MPPILPAHPKSEVQQGINFYLSTGMSSKHVTVVALPPKYAKALKVASLYYNKPQGTIGREAIIAVLDKLAETDQRVADELKAATTEQPTIQFGSLV